MRAVNLTISLLLCSALIVSVCDARLRLVPFGKRDNGAKSADSVPDGLAYISPTFDETKGIAQKTTDLADILAGYRSSFVEACASQLNSTSASFANHTTFGWFKFSRDLKKIDAVNDGVIVLKVACYESSKYDVDGDDPGKPVSEQTDSVIATLDWTKEKAAAQGKELIVQFDGYIASQNTTDGTSTSSTNTSSSTATTDNKTSGSKNDKPPTSSSGNSTSTPVDNNKKSNDAKDSTATGNSTATGTT